VRHRGVHSIGVGRVRGARRIVKRAMDA